MTTTIDRNETRLERRVRRHGWLLEKRAWPGDSDGAERYRIVDADDGSVIVGEDYSLDLDDVALWLE